MFFLANIYAWLNLVISDSEISQPAADSSVDKETKRRQEMKKIRKRYGLAVSIIICMQYQLNK